MTGKPVIPREQAERDIEDTIEHYLAEAGGSAAVGFIDDLQAMFERIARHPASGSPRYAHELDLPGLRCPRLSRYPYLAFYMEREDHVDVGRVLGEERDVPAWMHPLHQG